jgi:CheW-like protein
LKRKDTFGKWYDNFKTDDLNLSLFLSKFDNPHKRIHAVGEKVIQTTIAQGYDAAKVIAYEAKNKELRLMIDLFKEAEIHVKNSHRELAIIFSLGNEFVSLSADNVDNIIKIKKDEIRNPAGSKNSEYILGYAQCGEETCILLNINEIFKDSIEEIFKDSIEEVPEDSSKEVPEDSSKELSL